MTVKTHNKLLIGLVIAVASVLAVVVVWGMIIGFEADVSAEDRALLPTVADLGVDPSEIDPNRGTYRRTNYIDGTYAVEYEYEDPNYYMFVSVDHERNERDARTVLMGGSIGASLVMQLEDGVELVEDATLYTGADQRECGRFEFEGTTYGYQIGARKGSNVVWFSVSGFVWEDPDLALREIIDPVFDRM